MAQTLFILVLEILIVLTTMGMTIIAQVLIALLEIQVLPILEGAMEEAVAEVGATSRIQSLWRQFLRSRL